MYTKICFAIVFIFTFFTTIPIVSAVSQVENYFSDYLLLDKTESLSVYRKNNLFSSFKIFLIDKDKMSFGVSTTRPDNKDFFLNSNFFGESDPIGLVVVDGKRQSSRAKGGGYFYVKNGIPYVRSYWSPQTTEFNSQTILSGINDGIINDNLLSQQHSKVETFRSLVGEDSKGNIVVVVSDNLFAMITIRDIVSIGKDFDIQDGILFDGGSSIDYKLTSEQQTHSFKAMSSFSKKISGTDEPMVYIYGDFK
jgi:uncharacterized protein YigE (DUF2233 family)